MNSRRFSQRVKRRKIEMIYANTTRNVKLIQFMEIIVNSSVFCKISFICPWEINAFSGYYWWLGWCIAIEFVYCTAHSSWMRLHSIDSEMFYFHTWITLHWIKWECLFLSQQSQCKWLPNWYFWLYSVQ